MSIYALDNDRGRVTPNFTELAGIVSSPLLIAGSFVFDGYQDVSSFQVDPGNGDAAITLGMAAKTGTKPQETYPIDSGGDPKTITYTQAGVYFWTVIVTLANGESFKLDPIKVTIV